MVDLIEKVDGLSENSHARDQTFPVLTTELVLEVAIKDTHHDSKPPALV